MTPRCPGHNLVHCSECPLPYWTDVREPRAEQMGERPLRELLDQHAETHAKLFGDPRTERMAFLERKREAVKADLILKFEDGDHHGVADAAMDLRDIESELKGLRWSQG